MEVVHDITPRDIRRIASVAVLQNGGTTHVSQCRDLVAQLSKVLQSVSIAPADMELGHSTLNNPGTFFAVCLSNFEDYKRRCALYMRMADGSLSVSEAFDIVTECEITLEDCGLSGYVYRSDVDRFPFKLEGKNAFSELMDLWRSDAPPRVVTAWARARALAALTEYANEYVSAGALEYRYEAMKMLADVRAYIAPRVTVLARLLLLAAVSLQLASWNFRDMQNPPDIRPVVSLLFAAVILAPRAPQFRPAMA